MPPFDNGAVEALSGSPRLVYLAQGLDAAAIVATTDARGRITHCNDLFCEVSGYSRNELLGSNHRILNSGLHEPGFFAGMYAEISKGRTWKGTICNRRKSGDLYWVDTTVVPEVDSAGRVAGYLAVRFEVTAHVQALQDLAKARAEMQAALEVKSRFVANVSHELRTPLTGIIGMTKVLESTDLSANQGNCVRRVLEASTSLKGLVDDILRLAQSETGKVVLATKPTDALSILRSVTNLLEPKASEKGLALTLHESALPPLLEIDPLRTRQVLTNLVGNAIKFTDKGEVSVQTDWKSGRLICAIQDTGCGFVPEQKERLFKPFEQGDDARSRSHGGAGLGLAICRELVHAMGGDIDAESIPGQGSRFTFEISAPVTTVKEPAAHTPTQPGGSGRLARRISVLVAEDNATIQEILRHVLGSTDCKVTFAADGLDAIAAVRAGQFDLCLMDLRMPRMDGFAAASAIRQLPEGRHLPIIALSADLIDGRLAVTDECEVFDGFLPKPFDPAQIIELVAAAHKHPRQRGRELNTLAEPHV